MPNNPRLFIELIRKANGIYPSWQPSQRVEVGDYGTVNKETGEFDKEGSIYDPSFQPDLRIAESFPPESFAPDDKHIIASRGVKQLSFGADAIAKLPPIGYGEIKGHWTFTNGRGAVLVIYRPTCTRIKEVARLLPAIQNNPLLAEKALVASVYACPMYALLLTNETMSKAEAVLALSADTGDSNVSHAKAGTHFRWLGHSSSGIWKSGGEGGDYTFYPLYDLRTPKTPSFLKRVFRTREPPKLEGEGTFYPYQPPWSVLDEDGDEEDDE